MTEIRYGVFGNGGFAWEVYELCDKVTLLYTFTADEEKSLCRAAITQIKDGKIKEIDKITLKSLKLMKSMGVAFNKSSKCWWYGLARDRAVHIKDQLERDQ